MRRLYISLLGSLLLALGPLAAQGAGEGLHMELDQALATAMANNYGIRSQGLDTAIAERNYLHRFNVLLPSISATATLARPNVAPSYPTPMPPGTPDLPRWNLSTSLGAQLTLASQMVYGVRAVGLAYDTAEIHLAEARRKTELEVSKAFYSTLLLQEQTALTERRIAAAEARLAEITANYRAGLVDELSLRRTQVGVESQRPLLLRQRQALEASAANLAFMLGLPAGSLVYPRGTIRVERPELPDEASLRRYLANNADFQALARAELSLGIQNGLTRSEFLPSLTIGFSYAPRLSGDPFSGDLFDSDRWNDGGALSLTLRQGLDPFLPASRTRQELANQADSLKKLRLQQDQLLAGLEMQLRQLLASLTASEQTLASLEANLALAERVLYLAEEAYAGGLRDYAVIRDAEIDLADAQLQYLQEQYRATELLLDLSYVLNTPLETIKETLR